MLNIQGRSVLYNGPLQRGPSCKARVKEAFASTDYPSDYLELNAIDI